MTTINKLSAADQLSPGDLLALWATNNGDSRKASINLLTQYLQGALTFPSGGAPEFVTQFAAPNTAGFNIQIQEGPRTWLILTPPATLASGTITLPPVASVVNGQEFLVNSTQQITAITVDGNGASGVFGTPAALGADASLRYKYDNVLSAWYRIS
jgi:hypothetical protein